MSVFHSSEHQDSLAGVIMTVHTLWQLSMKRVGDCFSLYDMKDILGRSAQCLLIFIKLSSG